MRVSVSIDALMERASRALEATDYFGAASRCVRAMGMARRAGDFGRMARICLPLQEARRQLRDLAMDSGRCVELRKLPAMRAKLASGCVLLTPPLTAASAKTLRARYTRARVPVMVLSRENGPRKSVWTLIAGSGRGRIGVDVNTPRRLTPAWMIAVQESLGDAAIRAVPADTSPAARVDALLKALAMVPDHEKVMQALAAACHDAA